MWQTKCNDGGAHRFGPTDVPDEALCEVCRMSVGEVRKRKMSNRVIRSLKQDPYTRHQRDIIRPKLIESLRILDRMDKEEAAAETPVDTNRENWEQAYGAWEEES